MPPRLVLVPFERVEGWLSRYDAAHPATSWTVLPAVVVGSSPDGTTVEIAVPFEALEQVDLSGLLRHLERRWRIGLLIVRRGGFAVARLDGAEAIDVKIGRRHVQGKTKAGGWSQHRFARRRDNQARAAFDAAAEHAERVIGGARLQALATGGDRQAVSSVLQHGGLAAVRDLPRVWLGGLPDPTRAVLDTAIQRARSVQIAISDPVAG